MMTTNLGLYIHAPFCERKCHYCDFNSFKLNENDLDKYVDSLGNEIDLHSKNYKNYTIDTIFIGGGTPSLLEPKHIKKIDYSIKKSFKIDDSLEYTIECNPNSVSKDKLQSYKDANINRISLGVQSIINNELTSLGRIHDKDDIYKSVNLIKSMGYDNINLDLMLGIPNQDLESLNYTINEVIKLDVTHISCYGLIIEEGTLFGKLNSENKLLNLPSEELERNLYYFARKKLEENGFIQYEISNFSKKDFQSKHNLKYWRCEDYLGIGLGSHSKINTKRFENSSNFKDYIENLDDGKLPISNLEDLDEKDLLNERIIMGLRLNEGIKYTKLNEEFKIDFLKDFENEIDKNLKLDFIEFNNKKMRLTRKGMDFLNLVELDFYRWLYVDN